MKVLTHKQHGMGGIFFLTITMLMAAILAFVVRTSWASTAQSTANNLAFMISMSCTVDNYNTNQPSYDRSGTVAGPVMLQEFGGAPVSYNPLQDFNDYLEQLHITSNNGAGTIRVQWDQNTKTTTLYLGPVQSYFGVVIQTDPQSTVVE